MPIVRTLGLLAMTGALTAAGVEARPPQRNALHASTPLKIVAFGDSLTSGHRLPKGEAYPAVLESLVRAAGLPFTVVNKGVSGDTTAGALRRLESALAEDPRILIVAFGANDGLRGVPVAQVRANLDRIIAAAEDRGVAVLLCGMEALPIHGLQYTLDFHGVIPGLAAQHGVPLVPFLLSGVIGNPDLMTRDNIHPNAAGARVMAANIWTYLRPLAERVASTLAAVSSH
jgi:acyl-CoA thioesterase-1